MTLITVHISSYTLEIFIRFRGSQWPFRCIQANYLHSAECLGLKCVFEASWLIRTSTQQAPGAGSIERDGFQNKLSKQ